MNKVFIKKGSSHMEGKEKNHNFSSILFGLLEWYEWQNHVVKILYIHTYIYIYIYVRSICFIVVKLCQIVCVVVSFDVS